MKNITTARTSQSKSAALRTVTAVAALGILSAASQAAIYFVSPTGSDSNAGTIAKPFATLYKATMKSGPGDVVYLRGGVYKFTAPQTVQGRGSGTAWMAVQSYPGETATLDFSALPAGKDGLQVAGAFVRVSNMNIQNAPKANLSAWGANNVAIKSIKSTGSYAAGILVGSSAPGGSWNVEVSNCEITNCVRGNASLKSSVWQPALQMYQANDVKVLNNNVHQNFGEGIGFCTVTQGKVQSNKVWDNFSVNVYLDNVDNVEVATNFIYTTADAKYYRGNRAASGISLCVEGVTNPIGLRNSSITNNTITNCFAGIWYSSFGLGGGLKNVDISRNTVYKSLGGPLLWIDADKGHLGNNIKGNVFQQSGSSVLSSISTATGLGLGNNCWYGGSAGLAGQTSDLLRDPMLVRPGTFNVADYALKDNSPCIAKGIGVVSGAAAPLL